MLHFYFFWTKLGRGSRLALSGMAALTVALLVGLLGGLRAQAQTQTVTQEAKDKAVQLINDHYQEVLAKIQDHYTTEQSNRLVWLGLILIILMPLIGFFFYFLFPYFSTKIVRQNVPPTLLGKVRGLYFVQALIAGLVLFSLGLFLWLIQFWVGALGSVTNPQIALQEQTVNYIHDNARDLVENYTDIFVGVANDLGNSSDDAVLTIIMDNAQKLRNDDLINLTIRLVNFVWPLTGYTYLVLMGLVLVFFLRRLWPDLRRMLRFPVEVATGRSLEPVAVPYRPQPAPYQNYGPPPTPYQNFGPPPGYYPNQPPANYNPNFPPPPPGQPYYGPPPSYPPNLPPTTGTMWKYGGRLVWNEVRVMLCFALVIFVLAIVMGIFLQLFFTPIVSFLVELTSVAMYYFLREANASGSIVASTALTMVFLVECIVLFLLAFAFLVGKILDALRSWLKGNLKFGQSMKYLGRNLLRFLWVVLLATVLGIGLTIGANKLALSLLDSDSPNWTLGLIAPPLLLLVGLNGGFWLLRGFRSLRRLRPDLRGLEGAVGVGTAFSNSQF